MNNQDWKVTARHITDWVYLIDTFHSKGRILRVYLNQKSESWFNSLLSTHKESIINEIIQYWTHLVYGLGNAITAVIKVMTSTCWDKRNNNNLILNYAADLGIHKPDCLNGYIRKIIATYFLRALPITLLVRHWLHNISCEACRLQI